MNSNPKDRDRPMSGQVEARPMNPAHESDAWSRGAQRRKDAARTLDRDPDLPTHVVGEHQTD